MVMIMNILCKIGIHKHKYVGTDFSGCMYFQCERCKKSYFRKNGIRRKINEKTLNYMIRCKYISKRKYKDEPRF